MKPHHILAAAAVAAIILSPMAAGACVYQVIPPPPACTPALTFGAISRATLVVGNGQVACLEGTTINGSVMVNPGGALLADSALVTGNVTTVGATYLAVCDSTVRGSVTAQSPSGFVHIGDDEGDCAPNAIRNAVSVLSGAGGYIVSGNTVGGNVTVNDNTGTQVATAYEIVANTIGGNLTCLRNSPTPIVEDNIVTGATTQCVVIIR